MKKLLVLCLCIGLFSCHGTAQKESKTFKVSKTEKEWKSVLSEKEFHVLRKAGTELPFSSSLNKRYESGIYLCKACETPLFKSEHKFDSGSGWPSFDKEIEGNVEFLTDYNLLFYKRLDIISSACSFIYRICYCPSGRR